MAPGTRHEFVQGALHREQTVYSSFNDPVLKRGFQMEAVEHGFEVIGTLAK
jgi:hypothetical protein